MFCVGPVCFSGGATWRPRRILRELPTTGALPRSTTWISSPRRRTRKAHVCPKWEGLCGQRPEHVHCLSLPATGSESIRVADRISHPHLGQTCLPFLFELSETLVLANGDMTEFTVQLRSATWLKAWPRVTQHSHTTHSITTATRLLSEAFAVETEFLRFWFQQHIDTFG